MSTVETKMQELIRLAREPMPGIYIITVLSKHDSTLFEVTRRLEAILRVGNSKCYQSTLFGYYRVGSTFVRVVHAKDEPNLRVQPDEFVFRFDD